MNITISPGASSAPYEQIHDQVVDGIRAGALLPGTRLPTVRQLAADLGLATNTVAKAYRRLETEGHVVTLGRNGTVVPSPPPEAASDRSTTTDEINAAAILLARAAQRAGVGLPPAIAALRRAWQPQH
ncbi:GntR family transcriptional regulator [Lapillicoccus sp.]|uniref:GntR family transcriptional regulator n=1 Tax=Lapillicoccus sp. TaxID=1909287 RepID=UPI0025F844B8|nr:GntR family transcriptional regulator [Lapillicoccus sp.]